MQYALPWLDPAEQRQLIPILLECDLIKFSNTRDLPLKSGGTTDIYINLRDARNHPGAIAIIADKFEGPLRRLNVDRFIEIPDSVSCFAGMISLGANLPYITIRDQPKAGRVTKASSIGSASKGSSTAIIDDVITDGESKIAPYKEARAMGLDVEQLVVLVDRQQGWQKKFAKHGINLPVWPGMTLHDVRRFLISDFAVMQRCDTAVEEKNPIIVALDGKSWEEILPIVERLRPTGCILKANDLLFDKGIDWLLPNLSVYGQVMADIKGHDITSTLTNIARHFLKCPPWAVTVHASGQAEMIGAVVEMFKGTPTKVLAVTVLTSFDKNMCEEVYVRQPLDEVIKLAAIAERAGAHGLVCSPEELEPLRALYPQARMELVTPGVRSPGANKGDQKRVATPVDAIEHGADHIVMGRQILGADDPVAEVQRVLTEELDIQ